ncbi:MAG TPA: hypothetical protein VFV52_01260 [Bacilli bacterium]|nr:hypothetical protein [Bacilli bacterium]
MADTQAILAYFNSPDDAQIAAERVQHELDIEDVQIDRISAQPNSEPTQRVMNPITGNIASHASLIQGTDSLSGKSPGILLGSDPVVSGMSGGDGNITGRDILLTVVCPKAQLDQALSIINECGGQH